MVLGNACAPVGRIQRNVQCFEGKISVVVIFREFGVVLQRRKCLWHLHC